MDKGISINTEVIIKIVIICIAISIPIFIFLFKESIYIEIIALNGSTVIINKGIDENVMMYFILLTSVIFFLVIITIAVKKHK